MPVVAANAPRRYVNRVSRLGASSVADIGPEGRRFLPPMPYAEASGPLLVRPREEGWLRQ
jgi:hypothetical protein